jgi:ATPase family AAA domain-containing protein 3A/B
VIYDEQKKLAQQQAQTKAQMARYEDELARKRMPNMKLRECGIKN